MNPLFVASAVLGLGVAIYIGFFAPLRTVSWRYIFVVGLVFFVGGIVYFLTFRPPVDLAGVPPESRAIFAESNDQLRLWRARVSIPLVLLGAGWIVRGWLRRGPTVASRAAEP